MYERVYYDGQGGEKSLPEQLADAEEGLDAMAGGVVMAPWYRPFARRSYKRLAEECAARVDELKQLMARPT